MFRLILLAVGVLGFASGQCPPNSLSLENDNTTCYSFHSTLSKFAQAQFTCNSFGAQLVSLKNEYINVFIAHYANYIIDDIVFFWTGASKLKNPTEFEWPNGEKLEYNRLPNSQGNGSCIVAEVNEGHWKAENCYAEFSFICEFPAGKGIIPKGANSIDIGVSTAANVVTETTQVFAETTIVTSPEETTTPDSKKITEETTMPPKPTTIITSPQEMTHEPTTIATFETIPPKVVTSIASSTMILPTNEEPTISTTAEAITSGSSAIVEASTTPSPMHHEPTTVCPAGWKLYNEKCYKIYDSQMSWSDAEAACKADGSHLISIHDEEETQFIYELGNLDINKTTGCKKMRQFWIGFNKLTSDDFIWSDGNEANYTNWLKIEPNNYLGNEKCVNILTTDECEFGWNDDKCDTKLNFICKKVAENGVTNIASTVLPTNPGFEKSKISTTPEAIKFEPTSTVAPVEQSTTPPSMRHKPTCAAGWELYNENCYKLYDSQISWSDAEAACKTDGSHLVSIHSAEENQFIHELGNLNATDETKCKFTRHFWIGFNKLASTEFIWSDGSETNDTNWLKDEPNNFRGNEKCVEIATTDSCKLGWNDNKCDTKLNFICKKPAEFPVNLVTLITPSSLQDQQFSTFSNTEEPSTVSLLSEVTVIN